MFTTVHRGQFLLRPRNHQLDKNSRLNEGREVLPRSTAPRPDLPEPAAPVAGQGGDRVEPVSAAVGAPGRQQPREGVTGEGGAGPLKTCWSCLPSCLLSLACVCSA